MKRSPGYIELARERIDGLVYEGPRKYSKYVRQLMRQLPLDTYMFDKLTDFAAHRAHLTNFCLDLTTGALEVEGDARALFERVLDYVWQCYVVAHRKAGALIDKGIEDGAGAMWALFMHMHGHRALHDETIRRKLDQPAADFAFCVGAASHYSQIVVSAEPLGEYSVRVHWQAVTVLVEALYVFAYSPDMYEYLHALLLRHAQLLAGVGDALMYDDPLYCDPGQGRRFLDAETSASGGRCYLNDTYLSHAETLLGPQVVRMNRTRWFLRLAAEQRVALDTSPRAREATAALVRFVEHLGSHDILRRFVVDTVREVLVTTHMMHGERVRFMRMYPRQNPDADNVLATLRHQVYMEMPVLLVKPIGDMAHEYAADGTATETPEVRMPYRPMLRHEREFLVGVVTALDVWFKYSGAPKDFVTARVHLEEMHVGRDELADTFLLPPQRPALVRCMRWHFVFALPTAADTANEADPARGMLKLAYAGTNVAAALACWLRCVRDQAVPALKLDGKIIHDMLAPLLGTATTATTATPKSSASVSVISF